MNYKTYNTMQDRDKDVEALMKLLTNDKDRRIHLIGSLDMDGITSETMLANCLLALGCDVHIHIQKKKAHGFSKQMREDIKDISNEIFICSDCGSSKEDGDCIRELKNRGNVVIIIDHHPMEHNEYVESLYWYSDVYTGASLTFRVLERAVELELIEWEDINDFAFMSLLATKADMGDFTREELLSYSYKHSRNNIRLKNESMLALIEVPSVDFDMEDYQFNNVISLVNAQCRGSNFNVLFSLFKSLSYDTSEASYLHKLLRVHKDKVNRYINKLISTYKYKGESVIYFNSQCKYEGANGLIAQKLSNNYGVPCVAYDILHNGSCRGSMRDAHKYVSNFKAYLNTLQGFKCTGHNSAAGVIIDSLEDLEVAIKLSKNLIPEEKKVVKVYPYKRMEEILDRERDMVVLYKLGYPKQKYVFDIQYKENSYYSGGKAVVNYPCGLRLRSGYMSKKAYENLYDENVLDRLELTYSVKDDCFTISDVV